MTKKPIVSIIFPAKNEGNHVKETLQSLFSVKTHVTFEAIVVDDHSDDGCCHFLKHPSSFQGVKLIETKGLGASNARNEGAKHANGEYFVFCDAHLQFEHRWLDRLLEPLQHNRADAVTPGIAASENPHHIGYGQTLNSKLKVTWNPRPNHLSETAILPGGCLMIHRDVFEHVGGFDRGFKVWGYEDVELSIKLWLFGYRLAVYPDVTILHKFRKSHPYQVSMKHVHYNLLRMAYSHFNFKRIQKCKKLIDHDAHSIQRDIIRDGVLSRREMYFKMRKYDDEWFFRKFNIPF